MTMRRIPTAPYADQKPGTSGLRKMSAQFRAPRNPENFVQSVFDAARPPRDFSGRARVVAEGRGTDCGLVIGAFC